MSTEPYAILAEDETSARLDCGCLMAQHEHGGVALYQCPTHSAAAELLKALQAMCLTYEATGDHTPNHYGDDCNYCRARAAIAKVEGK
jgi:hypothetical protein